MSDDPRIEELQRECARLRTAITEIRAFSIAHHDDEPCHHHLHGLKVDIPWMCDAAIGEPGEPYDEAYALLPDLSAGRVRGIARHWIRQDAPQRVRDELESHATWLDHYRDSFAAIILGSIPPTQ